MTNNRVEMNTSIGPIPVVRHLSVYIPMPDGVNIAVDIWLPDNYLPKNKVPTAIEFTRYWRVTDGHPPHSRSAPLIKSGVALAIADCRGSGASFGHREAEHSGMEAADFAIVIAWLAEQPWSNGNVVSIGVSYCANTAEYALVDAPTSLKAAVPMFSDFDNYTIGFPGGLMNKGFLEPWGKGVRAMDLDQTITLDSRWGDYCKKRIKPVDSDFDKTLLAQALQEHQRNVLLSDYLSPIEYRDDLQCVANFESSDRPLSPHLLQNNPRVKDVPSYHWASFTDAGTASGAIARFLNTTAPMRVVIGYWSHGGEINTNPFQATGLEASPTIAAQYAHIADYIHTICSEHSDKARMKLCQDRALYYYTAGAERWGKTDVWPPLGIKNQRWFLSKDNSLSLEKPAGKNARDIYPVDFDAGTGSKNRWDQIVKAVDYGDRVAADKKLLTYTSPALEQAVEITGHPVVYLQLSSTQNDGALIAYLEAVAPNGRVIMLTEGGLRLYHRKVSSDTPPYPHFGPYHTFNKVDALPIPVGETVEVGFECLPLSVQIPKGYALRLAIAGHDKDCFDRLPKNGEVTLNIFRHSNALSYIDLPVRYLNETAENKHDLLIEPFIFN